MLKELITPTVTYWKHDRSQTVGASEIGACARQTWMQKNGIAEERELGWGFGERGKHVEKWVYDRLKAAKIRIRWKQKTLSRGHLSATLDGMIGKVVVDIKSYDPWKKNIVEPKHLMQVQTQIGLANAESGLLFYVNASNFQDILEHPVVRDPAAYAAAHERATYIMTTTEPPPREGVLAGGAECRLCPFQTACLGAPIEDKGRLSEADTDAVIVARDRIKKNQILIEAAEKYIALEKESIREILRAADVRRAPGLARISRSSRTTLDQAAMEAAGIDLTPYRKAGRETETVAVE